MPVLLGALVALAAYIAVCYAAVRYLLIPAAPWVLLTGAGAGVLLVAAVLIGTLLRARGLAAGHGDRGAGRRAAAGGALRVRARQRPPALPVRPGPGRPAGGGQEHHRHPGRHLGGAGRRCSPARRRCCWPGRCWRSRWSRCRADPGRARVRAGRLLGVLGLALGAGLGGLAADGRAAARLGPDGPPGARGLGDLPPSGLQPPHPAAGLPVPAVRAGAPRHPGRAGSACCPGSAPAAIRCPPPCCGPPPSWSRSARCATGRCARARPC